MHAYPVLDGLRVGAFRGTTIRHTGYATAEVLRRKAERTLRILRSKLSPTDPHRLYDAIRALAALDRRPEIPALAARLREVAPSLPADVSCLWAEVAMKAGDFVTAGRILVEGLAAHPEHPDLHYTLLVAGGAGYLTHAAKIRGDGQAFTGIATTLPLFDAAVDGLARMGVIDPAALDAGSS